MRSFGGYELVSNTENYKLYKKLSSGWFSIFNSDDKCIAYNFREIESAKKALEDAECGKLDTSVVKCKFTSPEIQKSGQIAYANSIRGKKMSPEKVKSITMGIRRGMARREKTGNYDLLFSDKNAEIYRTVAGFYTIKLNGISTTRRYNSFEEAKYDLDNNTLVLINLESRRNKNIKRNLEGLMKGRTPEAREKARISQLKTFEKKRVNIDKNLLYNLYIKESKTIGEVSEILTISYCVVERRIREYGLQRTSSEARKVMWRNPENAKKIFAAREVKPNKEEKRLDYIIQANFPNQWEYVGDGKLWIEGKNPDWVSLNSKKLIEYYGCYYHCCKECGYENVKTSRLTPEEKVANDIYRLQIFNENGYQTAIIRGHDSLNYVVNTLRKFIKGGISESLSCD